MRLTGDLPAGEQIELNTDGSVVFKPAPESPGLLVPVCAAVTLEDFERQVELRIDGVKPLVFALANKYSAYAVKCAGFTARSSRHSAAAAATPAGPSRTDPSQRGHCPGRPEPAAVNLEAMGSDAAASTGTPAAVPARDGSDAPPPMGRSGLYDEPRPDSFLAVHKDASWVVPLTLFDRFVRSCAEPSAQAAWHLQARFAVRAAAEAAFMEIRASGMGQRALSDLLLTGRVTASVAFAAAAALLPFATAVVASAFSAYAHGGCAGAWAGFLPSRKAEDMLRAQAVREGGPGGYLLRLRNSRVCEVVISYTALEGADTGGPRSAASGASNDGGICVVHESLGLSPSGTGVVFRKVEYPAYGHAVCAQRAFLKSPCLTASLAVIGWAMPADPAVSALESCGVFPSALSAFSDLVAPAVTEAAIAQHYLEAGAAASPFTHVGAGLPLLSCALYGRDLARLPCAAAFTDPVVHPVVQLLRLCDEQQRAGRFLLPALSFSRMHTAANHKLCVSHALPGVTSPAALATTAWAGPLPVPSPDVLPTASQFSSGSTKTLHPYAFSGFHAALIYEQTLARLSHKRPGSFLLRESQSRRGSAVLAFIDADGKLQQSIISPETSSTCAGSEKAVCSGNTFSSLHSVISAYSKPPAVGTPPLLRAAVPPASDRVSPRSFDLAADTLVFSNAARFEVTVGTPAVAVSYPALVTA